MGGTAVEESAWVPGFPYWLPHLGPIADHLHPPQLVFLPCLFQGSISCRTGRTPSDICKASSTGQAWNKNALMGGVDVHIYCCCCSVAKSCLILCDPMDCSTPGSSGPRYLGVCSNSCPLSQRCYLTISSWLPGSTLIKKPPASAGNERPRFVP